MANPGSLGELALDTLGKYVYDLCSKLTTAAVAVSSKNQSKRRKCTSTTDIDEVKGICERLHEMLTGIPVSLANDVTNKLIVSLDIWEYEIGKCRKGSLEEQIYTEIVLSVIHPGVSNIEPGEGILNCFDIFRNSVFCSYLCRSLIIEHAHTLKALRKINVHYSSYRVPHVFELHYLPGEFGQVEFSQQLAEFSGRCDDEVLFKIVTSCKNLKYLDVSRSIYVTKVAVSYILQLDHLEKLNIMHTMIQEDGIMLLLEGLFEKFGKFPPLKFLAFSCHALYLFKLLENFPDLKINLHCPYVYYLNFENFSLFKNVCKLQITTTLNCINKILREIGSQLMFLDVEIRDFDPFIYHNSQVEENCCIAEIMKVGQYCKYLKCFHISIGHYSFPRMPDFVRQPLPGFQTVSCLNLKHRNNENF